MDIILDYEGRSEIDLFAAGQWRYAADPSTEVTCVSYALRESKGRPWQKQGVVIFVGGSEGRRAVETRVEAAGICVRPPDEFLQAMQHANLHVAHNAPFERAITICKFPELNIPLENWSCTMARAQRTGLPAALEGLMQILGGPPKDMEGNRIMLQLSKPKPKWKKTGEGEKYYEDADRLARNAVYCARDIDAEIFADERLPELDDVEKRRWMIVQRENTRGISVDFDFLEKAWAIAEIGKNETIENVISKTGGLVSNLNSVADIHAFIGQFGIRLENLRAADLERYLTEDPTIPSAARTVLEGRLIVAKSSIQKLAKIKYRMMADGKVRDLQIWHGAHTGRTTGAGPQPLNQPRPGDVAVEPPKKPEDGNYIGAHKAIKDFNIVELRRCVAKHARERVIGVTAGVKQSRAPKQSLGLGEAVSGALRGVFVASPGKKLVVCDFSGIETAALMTVAGQKDRLQQIRDKVRLYSVFASQVYGYPVNKKDHPTEDMLGKQGVLSLGYGSWADTFITMCAQYGIIIDLDLSTHVVKTYRQDFAPEVPKLWYSLQDAATSAVSNPGRYYEAYGAVFFCRGDWLYLQLPSGRWLHYPGVELTRGRRGLEPSCLKWEKKQLVRKKLYGGLFAENWIQGFCRDIMVEAEEIIDADPRFDMLFTTYDELISEVDESIADECYEFMRGVMSKPKAWIPDMPLSAEGWTGYFYKKD